MWYHLLINSNSLHSKGGPTIVLCWLSGDKTLCAGSKPGSLGAFFVLLPGKVLKLSSLVQAKKFRGKGNKEGAVAAFEELQQASLVKLISEDSQRGAPSASVINLQSYLQPLLVLYDLVSLH